MNFKIVLVLLVLINVQACTSRSDEMFDENTPTSREVLTERDRLAYSIGAAADVMPMWSSTQMSGFTRSQATELENIFPTYPNPTIYMYIDPHITQDGLPVPGYTTKFRMFTVDSYALPSEIAPTYSY